MRDDEEEIREIKKEVIESRGLIIKTNNLTNALAADIKSIAKRQAGYERRFNWNSGIAYILFATTCFVGLKLASDARIREIASETADLKREVGELRTNLGEETRRSETRTRAEERAAQFYELIRAQKRAEVVEGFETIRTEQLSRAEAAFFSDTVDRFRLDLSMAAYQTGLDHVRTGRYAEAIDAFEEAVALKEEAAHIPAVKLALARSLMRLGRHGEAVVFAQAVIDQGLDRELQDDGAWTLSQCAEEIGQIDDARNALRLLVRKWPHSALAPDARRHLTELNRRVLRGGAEALSGAPPVRAPSAAQNGG